MTAEELRLKLMNRIDALLARSFLVYGQDRQLLTALRAYVSVVEAAQLEKILAYMPRGAVMTEAASAIGIDLEVLENKAKS